MSAAASRILLLGGTGDALRIARALGARHVYSLAGLGKVPDDLVCEVRVGGFGGAAGLAAYLRDAGVPVWALRRAPWQPRDGDDWRMVDDWAGIEAALAPFRRPLFTLGREPLAHLDAIPPHQFWLVRCLDPHPGNARAQIVGARGPFSLEGERALFALAGIDVVVSKNSGGAATEAKLDGARERGLPVVMLRRPPLPDADRAFESAAALLGALGDAAR